MFDKKQIIVIDCGSGTIKAGFSGEKSPHSVFRSIIGYKKNLTIDIKIHEKEYVWVDDQNPLFQFFLKKYYFWFKLLYIDKKDD